MLIEWPLWRSHFDALIVRSWPGRDRRVPGVANEYSRTHSGSRRLSTVGQLIFTGLGLGELPGRSLIVGSDNFMGDDLERNQAV